jgi:hypothetical protein
MAMHLGLPTRLDAVRAGWEFPGYIETLREVEAGRTAPTPGIQQSLSLFERGLTKVFRNPAFELSQVANEYKARRGSNQVLEKALFGLPEYVFRWFRVGQTCISAIEQIHDAPDPEVIIIAVGGNLAQAGMSAKKQEEILAILRDLASQPRGRSISPAFLDRMRALDAAILSAAAEEDNRAKSGSPSGVGDIISFKPGIWGLSVDVNKLIRWWRRK